MMRAQMVILLLAAVTLVPDPENPRKLGESDELRIDLRLLGQDMKRRGVLVPLLVRRNGDVYVVIDGHRRLAAALLVGIDTLPCIVVEGNITPEQALEIALITSLHKQDLSIAEKVRAYLRLRQLSPGSTAKDLAARLSIDPSLASMYQCYEHCIPEVQKAFDDGKLVLKAMNAISRQPPEAQGELLEMSLAGLPGEEIVRRARKRANSSSEEQERSKRIRIDVGDGIVVVITGAALGLAEGIEAVGKAKRIMEQGAKDGLSAKTISKVSVEKAKKGEPNGTVQS